MKTWLYPRTIWSVLGTLVITAVLGGCQTTSPPVARSDNRPVSDVAKTASTSGQPDESSGIQLCRFG
jgi:hypothetical protein